MKRHTTLLLLLVAVLAVSAPGVAETAPTPPAGVTAIALDGKVSLAWPRRHGRDGLPGVPRDVGRHGHDARRLADERELRRHDRHERDDVVLRRHRARRHGRVGQVGVAGAGPAAGPVVLERQRDVVENCTPGSTGWKLTNAGRAYDNGIEGFATATSVNAGSSVDLKVSTAPPAPTRRTTSTIYRMGYYGGSQGRLVSTLPGLQGVSQPGCDGPDTSTGLVDCGGLVGDDHALHHDGLAHGRLLAAPRARRQRRGQHDPARRPPRRPRRRRALRLPTPPTRPTTPTAASRCTLQLQRRDHRQRARRARSRSPTTAPTRRPYNGQNDWYRATPTSRNVAWLERNGYDLDYTTSTDLHTNGGQRREPQGVRLARARRVLVGGRCAPRSPRRATRHRPASGSARTQVYWRIRFETSPSTGAANRVEACYKTTECGAADPVSATGTWRDPAGANRPRTRSSARCTSATTTARASRSSSPPRRATTRVWRHTAARDLAAGASHDARHLARRLGVGRPRRQRRSSRPA